MKKNILIVEDERIVAEDIRSSLINSNYEIIGIVSTGEEAVEKAKELHPNLILMDIVLDGEMDGIDAAKVISDDLHIPVVYLTANAEEKTLERAKKTNPYGYLVKPFEDIDLNATLEIAFYKFNSEKELKKSEERFRKLIQENTDGIVVIDEEGNICFANKAAEVLFERKKEKLIGEKFKYKFSISELTEHKVNRRSKGKCVVEIHVVETEWNKKKAYLATIRDVTGRKETEEKLKKSNEKLQKLMEDTVNGLVSAIEMRDPYTAGHQKRVACLACAIAKEMKLSEDKINGIRISALVHDIGKIHIPSEILSKPGKLSDVEFTIVKSHANDGYEVLKSIDFPWPIAKTVLQHHEKIDGSSYPNGLDGNNIILEAKILCVADVIEAMSSHRPYRPALGLESALDEISKNRGILYDENVVDACIKIFEEEIFSFKDM